MEIYRTISQNIQKIFLLQRTVGFQNNENTMEHSDSDLIVTGAMTIVTEVLCKGFIYQVI